MSILNLESQKPSISQVENAFQPAREVSAPDKFAGRKEAVQQRYFGLIGEGSHIAVVGNRGIGKTSLARQILNLASGDNELLEKLGLAHDRKLDFLPIYFTCGDSVGTVGELLHRILTSRSCLADWIYDIPSASKLLTGLSPRGGAHLLGVDLNVSYESKKEISLAPAITDHPTDAVFTNVVSILAQQQIAPDGLLIVVDEFDQITDPSGFAAFLKSLATNVPKVKFCIVGVAQDVQVLMKEHQSSDRLFAGAIVTLPSMSPQELAEIIRIAEASIDNYIHFRDDAVDRMVNLAQGHPYMVHLVGKYALRHAFHELKVQITADMIDETMKTIAERQADPVLEGRYKRAVASSEQREIGLKSMSETVSADGEVWTTNAYKLALDQCVDNASQYVGQLVTEEYGGEVEKLRDRYYRFNDSLFAAYVRARPRLVQKTSP